MAPERSLHRLCSPENPAFPGEWKEAGRRLYIHRSCTRRSSRLPAIFHTIRDRKNAGQYEGGPALVRIKSGPESRVCNTGQCATVIPGFNHVYSRFRSVPVPFRRYPVSPAQPYNAMAQTASEYRSGSTPQSTPASPSSQPERLRRTS